MTTPATVSVNRKPPRKQFVSLDALLTVDDWVALPDTKPRYELIEGRLRQKMTTKRKHSAAATNLLIECATWGRNKGWRFFMEGTGLKINERTGYVPDVEGFAPGTVFDPEADYDGPPFLICKVLSRSTSKKDRGDKLRDYALVEVQLYLILDPDKKTLEVYRLENQAYGKPQILSENDVWQPAELPGLRLELAQLWL